MLRTFSLLLVAVSTAAASPLLGVGPLIVADGLGGSGPAGKYAGSKSVLGEKVQATLDFTNTSSLVLTITGAISLSCQEDYTYSDPTITLTNAGTSGDCVHDELEKEHASLGDVTYDSGSNQITVKVKISFLTVSFVLDSSSSLHFTEEPACRLSLHQAVERYGTVFSTQQPDGSYTFAKHDTSVAITFSSQQVDITTTVDGNSSECTGVHYRLVEGGKLLLPSQACLLTGMYQDTLTYDPYADSVTVKMVLAGRQSTVELSSPAALADAHARTDLARLYSRYFHVFSQAAPSGSYAGEKSVLGEKVDVTMTVDTATSFDFTISGVISLDCKNEAYSYTTGSSAISLPNSGKAGDCVHDALEENHVTLESITYDTSSNSIAVEVKYSFLKITIDLKSTGEA